MRRTLVHYARDVAGFAQLIRSRPFRYLAAALMVTLGIACAAEAADVIRVEEDWELVVRDPDVNNSAPQVICMMAPVANTESVHIALVLNHKTLPGYAPGGIQLQVWNGEQPCGHLNSTAYGVLRNPNETIRWTTRMSLQEGALLFEVTNGSSTSWGAFGGDGELRASLPCSISSLSAYSPNTSRTESSVRYAANRVGILALKEVRYYSSAGLVHRDTIDRVVFQHD
jgi:hypothetical protein